MEYKEDIKSDVEKLYYYNNVIHPLDWELRQMAETHGTITEFGNVNFPSSVRNRSAGLTVYLGSSKVGQTNLNDRQREIIRNSHETIKKVIAFMLGESIETSASDQKKGWRICKGSWD